MVGALRILVTGGLGFIGSDVVDGLVGQGRDVVVLDCLHPGAHGDSPDYINPGAEWLRADLLDERAVKDAVSGVDAVCHQASLVGLGRSFGDITDYVRVNDVGTSVLLAALAESGFSGRFVLASSMAVYGEGDYRCDVHGIVRPGPRMSSRLEAGSFDPPCPTCGGSLSPIPICEESVTDPRSVYAATKLHQEHLCRAFARETGVSVAVLRYHNVYGPRMPRNTPYAGVASVFRSALESGRAPEVFEDGGQIRDFVHVADVARANVNLLVRPEPVSGTFNISSGTPHTIGEMAESLGDAFGWGGGPIVTGRYRLGDVRHIFAPPDKAQATFGYKSSVSFEAGMREFATAPLRAAASISSGEDS